MKTDPRHLLATSRVVDSADSDETRPPCARRRRGEGEFRRDLGYPMHIFKWVLERAPLDVVLSYNHYTLQNTMLADLVPFLKAKAVGIMNAAPFSARLLTDAPLPPWHKATPQVREVARRAAEHCRAKGSDIARSPCSSRPPPDMATCIVGSATRTTCASGPLVG